jgi:hypothetical protein
VEQLLAFDQLQLRFRDPVQRRYAIIRPLLWDECTAAERAAHTHLHPDTIGKLKRRFEQQGMLGLFPPHVEMRTRERRRIVALLQDYPEGLTPAEMRELLGVERSLSDTCSGMLRYGLLQRVGRGRYRAAAPAHQNEPEGKDA